MLCASLTGDIYSVLPINVVSINVTEIKEAVSSFFFFFKSMYITTPSILAPAERSLPNRNASDDGSRAKL